MQIHRQTVYTFDAGFLWQVPNSLAGRTNKQIPFMHSQQSGFFISYTECVENLGLAFTKNLQIGCLLSAMFSPPFHQTARGISRGVYEVGQKRAANLNNSFCLLFWCSLLVFYTYFMPITCAIIKNHVKLLMRSRLYDCSNNFDYILQLFPSIHFKFDIFIYGKYSNFETNYQN